MPKIDRAKRRRIMQRSQRLGHCICDPRRPCPCGVFTDQGICPCAGERPDPIDLSAVRLTELVHNAGCAAKIAPGDLEAVLSRLAAPADPAVIGGIPAGDDAAVYKLTDDVYLVQTVDVMTPCCDDPYRFGRVCAANCLSDIYAMGGRPRTALSVLAFPSETLDGRLMYEMLRGALEVFAQAGVALIGGHSIKDEEIELGFAVTGTVGADRVTGNDAAAVGDLMVLTKPLGSGVLGFARQVGRARGDFDAVIESMATLNQAAAEAAAEAGARACTDVTGFGLFGHLANVVRHSRVTAQVWASELPAFAGALEALAEGIIPGAVERNTEFVGDDLAVEPGVDPARVALGFDAQTSGGLLIFVPPERLETLMDGLSRRGSMGVAIGRITERSDGRIAVTANKKDSSGKTTGKTASCCDQSAAPARASESAGQADCCAAAKPDSKGGCCDAPKQDAERADVGSTPSTPAAAGHGHASDAVAQAQAAFGSLLGASAGGAIDERTKELIQYALVTLSRCGPCLQSHHKRAISMGITPQELEEAMWCAVAIGGAPVRMFYLETLRGLK